MKKNKIFERRFYYVEAQSMFLSLCKAKWICETSINCKRDQKSQQSTAIEHCLVLLLSQQHAQSCRPYNLLKMVYISMAERRYALQ